MGAMLSAREAEHATLMRYGMSDRERLRRIERDLEVVEEAWQRNGHINSMHTEEELLVHSAVNSMRNQAYILRCTIEARRGARGNLTRPLKKAKTSKQTRSSTTVSRVRFVDTLENTVQGKNRERQGAPATNINPLSLSLMPSTDDFNSAVNAGQTGCDRMRISILTPCRWILR